MKGICLCWTLFLLSANLAAISVQSKIFLADFTNGLSKDWKPKLLQRKQNRFGISSENGNKVLKVFSSSSASGIIRKWEVDPLTFGNVSWKWKVSAGLHQNKKERTKKGDDYSARLFLLFEPHFFSWRTPNICYVWAGNEPIGSQYKSPHTDSVCTIVLQSGNEKVLQWLEEERDFVHDYIECFQRKPKKLSGITIMVDTDDTRSETTAWFDDLKIVTKK